MGTRLRPIVMIDGDVRAGGHARMALEKAVGYFMVDMPLRGTMPEADRMILLFRQLQRHVAGQHWLWLFREPRGIKRERSRYALLCQYYGIKKRLTVPPDFDRTLTEVLIRTRTRAQQALEEERQMRERQQREQEQMAFSGITQPMTMPTATPDQWGFGVGNATSISTSALYGDFRYRWDDPERRG